MKKNNIYRVGIIFSMLFFWIFFSPIVTYAKDNTTQASYHITPHRLKEWDDGAKVKKKVSGSGKNYKLSVLADTTGLSEGYYSIYYYDYGKRNISSFDGMQYHFSNPNAFALKINTTLTISKKESASLIEDSYVILTSDDKTVNKVEKTSYGTITIPAGYTGMVYIPFSQFYTKDGKGVNLRSIMSWGITTVMQQQERANYEISDIAFLKNSVASKKASYLVYTIDGISAINIPNTGAAIESYQVSAKDMQGNAVHEVIDFSLPESIAGASITKDGTLEIQSECVATEITIQAKTKNSTNAGTFLVTLNHLTAKVAKAGVPRALDVAKISDPTITFAVKWLVWFRVGIIAVIVIVSLLLLSWAVTAKRHYMEIKQKLNEKIQQIDKEKKS